MLIAFNFVLVISMCVCVYFSCGGWGGMAMERKLVRNGMERKLAKLHASLRIARDAAYPQMYFSHRPE